MSQHGPNSKANFNKQKIPRPTDAVGSPDLNILLQHLSFADLSRSLPPSITFSRPPAH